LFAGAAGRRLRQARHLQAHWAAGSAGRWRSARRARRLAPGRWRGLTPRGPAGALGDGEAGW